LTLSQDTVDSNPVRLETTRKSDNIDKATK